MQGKSEQDLAICNSETYLYTIIDCVMDKMTPEQRHHCMSSIRSKNTKPEMVVRRYLFSRGFRFRVNVKRLPGTPDIVLRKYRTVIFVNGCFWHGHEGCKYFVLPKSNVEFWKDKIERNRRRDVEGTDSVALHGVACDAGVGMPVETQGARDDTERD